MTISPDGRFIAFVSYDDRLPVVTALEIEKNQLLRLAQASGPARLVWKDNRTLVYDDPISLGNPINVIDVEKRTWRAVGNAKLAVGAKIAEPLYARPDEVYVVLFEKSGVFNFRTGEFTEVISAESRSLDFGDFFANPEGRVVAAIGSNGKQTELRRRASGRRAGFEVVRSWDPGDAGLALLGSDGTDDGMFALAGKSESPRKLQRLSVGSATATDVATSLDWRKIEKVVLRGDKVTVAGIYESPDVQWWGIAALGSLQAKLTNSFPGGVAVLEESSANERRHLVRWRNQRGLDWYWLDQDSGALVLIARAGLPAGRTLAPNREVRFASSGGIELTMILTEPPGVQSGALPTVLMPYREPFSGAFGVNYDAAAQFFAAHGLRVACLNYRGTLRQGEQVRDAGKGAIDAIPADIHAAAEWLVAQGLSSPGQIALVGEKLAAGFAVLCGAQRPELYSRIVCIEGLLDWESMQVVGPNEETYSKWLGIGSRKLAQASPLNVVAKVTVPVHHVYAFETDVPASLRNAYRRQRNAFPLAPHFTGSATDRLRSRGAAYYAEAILAAIHGSDRSAARAADSN